MDVTIMDYIEEKEPNSNRVKMVFSWNKHCKYWCKHFGHLRLWSFSILDEVVFHYGRAHFPFWLGRLPFCAFVVLLYIGSIGFK